MPPKSTVKKDHISVTCKVPPAVDTQMRVLAQRAGISKPEVLEQLIWAFLDHLQAHWESGEPVPPRPWRDLPMPKKPVPVKPSAKETAEMSGLATYIASGAFPEVPETPDPPAQEPPEEMPADDGGSTRVVRRRRG